MSRPIRVMIYLSGTVLMVLVMLNAWVIATTSGDIHEQPDFDGPGIGLVLGTSKMRSNGEPNDFFRARMDAAARLYHEGVIEKIIVSGHRESKYYDEPRDMKSALEDHGIPSEVIIPDPCGIRTLHSLANCRTHFGIHQVVVITQKFHAYRALFIAEKLDIDAVAYAAERPRQQFLQVMFRELMARPWAVLDLYVWDSTPKRYCDS